MNKLMEVAISGMNYFFLKETFAEKNLMKEASHTISGEGYAVKGYDLYQAHIEELSLFLNTLDENWDESVENIVFKEMQEGDYVDNLTIDEIEKLLKDSIEYICGEENDKLLGRYLDI